jgi:hypothetical protein
MVHNLARNALWRAQQICTPCPTLTTAPACAARRGAAVVAHGKVCWKHGGSGTVSARKSASCFLACGVVWVRRRLTLCAVLLQVAETRAAGDGSDKGRKCTIEGRDRRAARARRAAEPTVCLRGGLCASREPRVHAPLSRGQADRGRWTRLQRPNVCSGGTCGRHAVCDCGGASYTLVFNKHGGFQRDCSSRGVDSLCAPLLQDAGEDAQRATSSGDRLRVLGACHWHDLVVRRALRGGGGG